MQEENPIKHLTVEDFCKATGYTGVRGPEYTVIVNPLTGVKRIIPNHQKYIAYREGMVMSELMC